jgi:DNA-directed RNA polymerase alpha subunit
MATRNKSAAREGASAKSAFEHRGLSERTIRALLACAIDCPERLLFVQDETLAGIPGVGAASLSEIVKYRDRFMP